MSPSLWKMLRFLYFIIWLSLTETGSKSKHMITNVSQRSSSHWRSSEVTSTESGSLMSMICEGWTYVGRNNAAWRFAKPRWKRWNTLFKVDLAELSSTRQNEMVTISRRNRQHREIIICNQINDSNLINHIECLYIDDLRNISWVNIDLLLINKQVNLNKLGIVVLMKRISNLIEKGDEVKEKSSRRYNMNISNFGTHSASIACFYNHLGLIITKKCPIISKNMNRMAQNMIALEKEIDIASISCCTMLTDSIGQRHCSHIWQRSS